MAFRDDQYNRWLKRGMPDRTAGERPVLNHDRMYEGEDRMPDRDDGSRHREDEWRDRADWSAGEGRFYRNSSAAVPDYDREWRYRQYVDRDDDNFRENFYRDYDRERDEYARRSMMDRNLGERPRERPNQDYRRDFESAYRGRERSGGNRDDFSGRHYDRDFDRSHWSSPWRGDVSRRDPDVDRDRNRWANDRDRDLDHFRGGYRDEDDYWRRERDMRERDRQRHETLDSIRRRREPWRS